MNLFLPEETVTKSVMALDDRRLIKQILECKTMLEVAVDPNKRGYAKHPVIQYYKDHPYFLAIYGYNACYEYWERFGRTHVYRQYFIDMKDRFYPVIYPLPFYCEGLKDSPNAIRTNQNTVELFRNKLCAKWDKDKIPPKWTNRQPPEWYKGRG